MKIRNLAIAELNSSSPAELLKIYDFTRTLKLATGVWLVIWAFQLGKVLGGLWANSKVFTSLVEFAGPIILSKKILEIEEYCLLTVLVILTTCEASVSEAIVIRITNITNGNKFLGGGNCLARVFVMALEYYLIRQFTMPAHYYTLLINGQGLFI